MDQFQLFILVITEFMIHIFSGENTENILSYVIFWSRMAGTLNSPTKTT